MRSTRFPFVMRLLPLVGVAVALPAHAQITGAIKSGLDAAAAGYGPAGGAGDLPTIIGRIISVLLSFSGVLLLTLLLYGGFLWMTAGGDKAKVEKATTTLKNAIIGLVIVGTAFAITDFVLTSLSTSLTGGTGT